jgi:hypothetical protein
MVQFVELNDARTRIRLFRALTYASVVVTVAAGVLSLRSRTFYALHISKFLSHVNARMTSFSIVTDLHTRPGVIPGRAFACDKARLGI